LQPRVVAAMQPTEAWCKILTLIVFAGLVLVVAGLGGLGYCIREGYRIRRANLPPDVVTSKLHRLIAVNLGAVALAALGLAVLVVGLVL